MPGFRAAAVGEATIASQGLATFCRTWIRMACCSSVTVVCPRAAQGAVVVSKVPFAMSWAAAEAGAGAAMTPPVRVAAVRVAASAARLADNKRTWCPF